MRTSSGVFPPSSYFTEGINPAYLRTHRYNWAIAILPFLEQQALHDAFDLSVDIASSVNRAARGTDLTVMKCPADTGGNVKFSSVNATEGDNWARGNYAANASLAMYYVGGTQSPGAGATEAFSTSRWHRGIMGSNLSMGVSEIYDGTSNTILLGEVRAGMVSQDRRGTWALDHPGASTLWGHAIGDGNGPNMCSDNSDDIMDCDTFTTPGRRRRRTASHVHDLLWQRRLPPGNRPKPSRRRHQRGDGRWRRPLPEQLY